jgi:hypothetical protein
MYAQADAFRIYRFGRGKWADLLMQTAGSAAARQEADRRGGGGEEFQGWLRSRREQQTALPKAKARDLLIEDGGEHGGGKKPGGPRGD